MREKFQELVDSYSIKQMKADLMELEPGERLRIMAGLLDFFIPKLNRTDHTMSLDNETIVIKLPTTEDTEYTEITDEENDNRLLEP